MPVIRTYTSEPVSESQRDRLKAFYGTLIERVPGKSEPWLMCVFDDNLPIYLGGSADEPAAYVTVDVFAREAPDHDVWASMTGPICDELRKVLSINPERVYVRYGWTPDFGWNGSNF